MAETRLILHVAGTSADTTELPRSAVQAALSGGQMDPAQLIWDPTQQAWKPAAEWADLMPQDNLILHVPGTESETRQMPKAAVRAAVATGELRRSQLIWNPIDSAWKAVREMPDLMPGDSVILHIKGTESGTRELPSETVRAAVGKGEMSHSQLIWSAPDKTWRQVRELPELMPGETLILHVKGTVSDVREVPKETVRQAVSKGELTQSQLIWSTKDNSWRELRALPDLVPGETMILHVKGTESQTAQLPKQAVVAAVNRGEITHSQLIWSPGESTWKPVRDIPELMPGDSLILHVKGTEAQTAELPRQAVRTAIRQGEITHSQLIWSAPESAWKQVRELPELLPSQKLAPAPNRGPVPMLVNQPKAVSTVKAAGSGSPVARAAVVAPPKVTIGAQPKVAVATPAAQPSLTAAAPVTAMPKAAANPSRGPVAAVRPNVIGAGVHSHVVKEEADGFHPLKWLCIVLGAVILLLVAVNYMLVDQRLESGFGHTTYSEVPVFAHFGAFVQPNVIVIHIPTTRKLTEADLTDFLVELARSTPSNMITNDLFQRVALTSRWTTEYSFSGYSWKQLGDMQQGDATQRKDFILAQISDAGGEPLVPASSLNEAAQEERRDMIWREFVRHFVVNP